MRWTQDLVPHLEWRPNVQVEAVAVPAGLAECPCRENGELAHVHAFPQVFSHTMCGTCWHSSTPWGKGSMTNITESGTALGKLRLGGTRWEDKVAERAAL